MNKIFSPEGIAMMRKNMTILMPKFSGFNNADCGELNLQSSKLNTAALHLSRILKSAQTEQMPSKQIVEPIIIELRNLVSDHLGRVIYRGDSKKSGKIEFISNKLPLDVRVQFINEVANLVNIEQPIDERLDAFVSFLIPYLESHYKTSQDKRYDITRSLPTFFLMLTDPLEHLCVATKQVNTLCTTLKISKVLKSCSQFDYIQYAQTLSLAKELFVEMSKWDWHPRNMVDVLFFIWSARTPN